MVSISGVHAITMMRANHHCCEEFNYDCETDCNSTTESSIVKFTKQSPGKYYNDPAGVKRIIPRCYFGRSWLVWYQVYPHNSITRYEQSNGQIGAMDEL